MTRALGLQAPKGIAGLPNMLGIGPSPLQTYQAQQQVQAAREAKAKQDAADAALHAMLTNPSGQTTAAAIALNPSIAAALKDAHAAQDEDQQRSALENYAAIHGYLASGQIDQAKAALQARVDADTKAGVDPTADKEALLALDTPEGVKAAQGMLGMKLAAIIGPEKYASLLGPEERARTATDTETAQAETHRHNLEAEAADRDRIAAEAAKAGTLPATGTPGTPALGAPAAGATPPTPTGGAYDRIATIAQYYGATPDEVAELARKAQIESGGNPTASNGSSRGLFAFHQATLDSALGRHGDLNNPLDQVQGALALQRADKVALQHAGVAPTPANAYIMHQQGAAGGLALLTAPPEIGAVAALTPAYRSPDIALQAIAGNIGMPYKTPAQKAAANAKAQQMTAGEFNDFWRNRWSGGAQPQGAGQPAAAQPGQPPAPAQQPYSRIPFQNAAGDDEPALSEGTLTLLATKYLSDGVTPPFGQGKAGTANRTRFFNRAQELAEQQGLTPNDLIAGTATTKALSRALTSSTSLLGSLQTSEETLNKNLEVMLNIARQGGVGGSVPVFNRWIQGGRRALAGDPQVTALNNAIDTAAAESAALMTRAQGQGGPPTTEGAMKEAHERFDKAGTLEQLEAAANIARIDGHNRVQSTADMVDGYRARLRAGPGGVPATAAPTPPTTPSSPPAAGAPTRYAPPNPGQGIQGGQYPVYTRAQADDAARRGVKGHFYVEGMDGLQVFH